MNAAAEFVIRLSSAAILGHIVRAALRHGTTRLPEDLVPQTEGAHEPEVVLHFEAAGFDRRVSVVGERLGTAEAGMVRFRFRPRTRVEAAELYLIAEQIDLPAESFPPSEEGSNGTSARPISIPVSIAPSDDAAPPGPQTRSEDTIVDRCFIEAAESIPPPARLPTTAAPLAPGAGLATSGVRPSPAAAAPLADPLLSRTIAGKYMLEALLGAGSAGAVYRGTHVDLGREVAVKVLHAQNRHEEQFVRRFKAEARAASKLDNRNVTRVLDFGQEPDGLLYLVMEYVAGRSLEAILQTEGRQPAARVVDIGIQVCNALVFAHKEGIIHRDIKPENLLLEPSVDDELNATDLVKGSPAYMSPEQIRGGALDHRTDIYALGMTLYEALTGAHPFTAETLLELFTKHENEPPRRPSEFVPSIDPLLEDVLMRALAKRPDDRHESARTLRIELREIAEQIKEQAPPSSTASISG